MKLVSAAFDLNIHHGATGHPLFSVITIGDDVHRLDRLGRRNVSRDVRQPRIADHCAIQLRIAIRKGHSIHVRHHRALRIAGIGVRFSRRREAGDRLVEVLEIAPRAHRQIRNLLARQLRTDVGLVRLQHRSVVRHRHTLVQCRHAHGRIEADRRIGIDPQILLLHLPKRRRGDRHPVGSGLQIIKEIGAAIIRRGRLQLSIACIERLHLGIGNRRPGLIGNIADQRTVKNLRGRQRRHQRQNHNQHQFRHGNTLLL